MPKLLKQLNPVGKQRVTPDTFVSGLPETIDQYVKDVDRPIDIGPFIEIVEFAMKKFNGRQIESDAWLASRVHSTLRLYRSEAANRQVWDYISLFVVPQYVKWRWTDSKTGLVHLSRITGPLDRHALSRLWWTAELTRNGSDYSFVSRAFKYQTAVQHLLELKAFRNRNAAIAFIEFLETTKMDGSPDSFIPKAAHAINHALTTTVLDALAPDPAPNPVPVKEWIGEDIDVMLIRDELPLAPDDPPINRDSVVHLLDLFERVKPKETGRRKTKAESNVPTNAKPTEAINVISNA